eukprot:Plantae.Rhodophyta-Purpureofilum_apyrenoidigerum.ctg7425.p1 GENE.Plantae.Rhodophyta-Purpureofilum_apyrenoidigerum.ctg7425~~Plantae.Rhodophyta-Purpureofilum_apyrenoidigerum.ctg7425.p1  ORF type:complete len:216 (+),score=41.18 Plantae.Rhodophyta-Purpureofilum_apyrenoidigerum.ctg7425:49-696(+)
MEVQTVSWTDAMAADVRARSATAGPQEDNVMGYDSPSSAAEWMFEEEHDESAMDERLIAMALSTELSKMCAINNDVGASEIRPGESLGRFFSKHSSNMPIEKYIRRIVRYMSCSKATYIVAYCYLHRLRIYEPRLVVSDLNSHRLFMTAMVLAAKYLEDCVYSNMYYARVGGIPTLAEMNGLEAEFLRIIHFDLAVNPEEYRDIESYLAQVAVQG